jgi:hypothetical protein
VGRAEGRDRGRGGRKGQGVKVRGKGRRWKMGRWGEVSEEKVYRSPFAEILDPLLFMVLEKV